MSHDANRCYLFSQHLIMQQSLESLNSLNIEVLIASIKQLDPFPLHAIFHSVWKNAEGIYRCCERYKFQQGHVNHAWLCLDLLEVLCQLAERGHAYSVRSLLEHHLKHCPEILLLVIVHINAA